MLHVMAAGNRRSTQNVDSRRDETEHPDDQRVVDEACIDHPVSRSLIYDNGLIIDPDARKAIRRGVVALSIATLE